MKHICFFFRPPPIPCLPNTEPRVLPSSAMFEDAAASEEWDTKKAQVLARFAAQGTITVSTSFDILGRAKRG